MSVSARSQSSSSKIQNTKASTVRSSNNRTSTNTSKELSPRSSTQSRTTPRPSSRGQNLQNSQNSPRRQIREQDSSKIDYTRTDWTDEELNQLKISDLYEIKLNAIEKMNFALTERILNLLSVKSNDSSERLFKKYSSIISTSIEKANADYQNKIKDLQEDRLLQEINLRKRIQKSIETIHQTYLEINIKLNIEYQVFQMKNEKRVGANVTKLQNLAKASARANDIKTANNYLAQAQQIQNQEAAERQKNYEKTFKIQRKIQEDKQKQDFEILSTKLKAQLEQYDINLKQQINDERTKLGASIRHLLDQKSREGCHELSEEINAAASAKNQSPKSKILRASKSQEKEFKDKLTKFTISMLTKNELSFIADQLKGLSSTKSEQ